MKVISGDIIVKDISESTVNDLWELRSTIVVRLSNGDYVTIPYGFVTDFASVPKLFWSAISPIGKTKLASLIHDYIYVTQIYDRDFADKEFYKWLQFLQPNKYVRNKVMYYCVNFFGYKRYNKYS